jgi:hypothetical protein
MTGRIGDGVYSRKPWGDQPPPADYIGPFGSNRERLIMQAAASITMPAEELQLYVRPNLPQIRLFPPRIGFGIRYQPDINDVISVDRVYTEPRVSWYSGSVAGYSGSSRNSLETI